MYFVASILILGLHVLDVKGHGAMVSPLSRNAIGKEIRLYLILMLFIVKEFPSRLQKHKDFCKYLFIISFEDIKLMTESVFQNECNDHLAS